MLGSRSLRFSRALPPGGRITAGNTAAVRLRLENASRFGVSDVGLSDHLPGRREFLARVAGVRVSDSTISRMLKRLGWSRKKDRWERRSATGS
jgi:hypothetical protein